MGFKSFPAPVFEDKVPPSRKVCRSLHHPGRLFFESQSEVEQNHIIGAFRFELSRVQTHAIRERIVSMMANVSRKLAEGIASGLGIPVPPAQPRVLENPAKPEVTLSPALSLFARPGNGSVAGRRVALFVCDGVEAGSLRATHAALAKAGAAPRFVGARLGRVTPADGDPIDVEVSMEAMPSVLWDGLVLPAGDAAQSTLAGLGQAKEFLKDQYRHCKPILVLGGSTALLEAASIPKTLPDGTPTPAWCWKARPCGADGASPRRLHGSALARHRVFRPRGPTPCRVVYRGRR